MSEVYDLSHSLERGYPWRKIRLDFKVVSRLHTSMMKKQLLLEVYDGGVHDGWATCGEGPKSSIEFLFKWPPNICKRGEGVMELDNEGGIGIRLCTWEHEEGRGVM